jgi:hypothetical protein
VQNLQGLRAIFKLKKNVTLGGCRKLHNVHFAQYNQNDQVKKMRWAGHVASIRVKKNAFRVLMWKTKGKRPLERLTCRWKDNLKTDTVGCYSLD